MIGKIDSRSLGPSYVVACRSRKSLVASLRCVAGLPAERSRPNFEQNSLVCRKAVGKASRFLFFFFSRRNFRPDLRRFSTTAHEKKARSSRNTTTPRQKEVYVRPCLTCLLPATSSVVVVCISPASGETEPLKRGLFFFLSCHHHPSGHISLRRRYLR